MALLWGGSHNARDPGRPQINNSGVAKLAPMSQRCTYLGDELIVLGQMCPAVNTAVRSMAPGQVTAEGLGREAGGGWRWLTAGHDRLESNALSRGGSRRCAAPAQAVASETAKQVG